MKVSLDVYAVTAVGRYEGEVETVEEAEKKALVMAKAHVMVLKPTEENYITVPVKCVQQKQKRFQ